MGVDATKTLNIHTIALQVPISQLTANRTVPTDAASSSSVIGVWSSASRRKVRMIDKANDERAQSGPWVQVSRLGNPLFNEVIVPLGDKDRWNTTYPVDEKQFRTYVEQPEVREAAAGSVPERVPQPGGAEASREPTSWRSC